MQRRRFFEHVAGLAASVLTYSLFASAEETCTLIAPYISRCTAGIPSERFKDVAAFQQKSQWCWAASIEMVFAFYKHRVPQKRIVEETWGSAVNMPGQPQQLLNDLNRQWTDDHGQKFSSSGDTLTANAATAVIDLRAGRPLIIGALGHATVLTALTSDVNSANGAWQVVAATVRDPWPANGGKRILSPNEWYNINFVVRIDVEDEDE